MKKKRGADQKQMRYCKTPFCFSKGNVKRFLTLPLITSWLARGASLVSYIPVTDHVPWSLGLQAPSTVMIFGGSIDD